MQCVRCQCLDFPSYLNSLTSRLSRLEDLVTRLQSRVSHIEYGETEAKDIGRELRDDQEAHLNNIDDARDRQDPTDGIGSIQFTKDAISGFFGKLTSSWVLKGEGD